jgi:hypothetical protein
LTKKHLFLRTNEIRPPRIELGPKDLQSPMQPLHHER